MLREGVVSASDTPALWCADALRFECTLCGRCCSGAPGYVWVTPDDIDRLAAHLRLTPSDFQQRHTRRLGYGISLLERPNGDCEFLRRLDDGTTRCTIHALRPVQCRTWPFWKSNLRSPQSWQRTATDCPGIGRGPVHPLPVIEAALRENGDRPL